MKLLKRKLVRRGNSWCITIPKDFIKLQDGDDYYFVVYVLDSIERKSMRA